VPVLQNTVPTYQKKASRRIVETRIFVRQVLPKDGVDVLEESYSLLHGGRHELLEVGDGEPLHNLVAQLLPHHQQERDGHVVIPCTGFIFITSNKLSGS